MLAAPAPLEDPQLDRAALVALYKYDLQPGFDYPGNDVPGWSPTANLCDGPACCAQHCTKSPDCLLFAVYDADSSPLARQCYLKGKANPASRVAKEGVTTGIWLRDGAPPLRLPHNGALLRFG